MVSFGEDDHGAGAIIELEAVDEFVVQYTLVDVDNFAEIVEDRVERPKPCVVTPVIEFGVSTLRTSSRTRSVMNFAIPFLPTPLRPVTMVVWADFLSVIGLRGCVESL